jgi:transposase
VVAAEGMFTWYWLADVCVAEGIPFVLDHALAMKAIHGGKAKNDKIDSHKVAGLLRGGLLPQAYVYPAGMRTTRDLLRRRLQYDALVTDLELTIVRDAKRHDADAFHRLRSVPGIGKVLALTILYEIHDIHRFDRVQEFASYARLVKCQKQSGGRTLGTSGAKMGNVHLKWAFSEAAVLFLRHTKDGKKLLTAMTKKHGKGKALSILAHRIGRAVDYMLSRGTVFSMEKFLAA